MCRLPLVYSTGKAQHSAVQYKASNSGGTACAMHIMGTVTVPLLLGRSRSLQAFVYGRMDIFRSTYVVLDHLTVTSAQVYKAYPSPFLSYK